MTKITGVIQAGGRSTRMGGEPKALLGLAGKRIVERVVDALSTVLGDLLVVTNTPGRYEFLRLALVAGRYPDGGSPGGLFTGVAAARGGAPEVAFMTVNTPDELAQARALAAEIG